MLYTHTWNKLCYIEYIFCNMNLHVNYVQSQGSMENFVK